MDHYNASLFKLYSLDKTTPPPAQVIEQPSLLEINEAIQKIYTHGGFLNLQVLKPENFYISELNMVALPKLFRLVLLTKDSNPKNGLLEWWDPEKTKFEGVIRFGDDEWDSRTVSNNILVAERIFSALYKNNQLLSEILKDFRSEWDPKP
ncbi:DUF6911 family protein [Neisseria yangbaofengii]|uniref:DUF6911 family protein n=1 Tax=Neisseria yangbaofengii TaxID=2709396 RepID=UPI0013ECDCE8|nr:hypothetical protein [Neisseria yangbaofengii]